MSQLLSKVRDRVRYQVFGSVGADRVKVVGVGLAKTATTSLNEALRELRINSIHYPECFRFTSDRKAVEFAWPWWLGKYDGFTDVPAAYFFREFDRMLPRVKFVLTVRDRASWLKSCKHHFNRARDEEARRTPRWVGGVLLNEQIYGVNVFDEQRFAAAYDRHIEAVRNYFKGRESDLLELDICGGEGVERLAEFLGVEPPRTWTMPRENVGHYR